VKKVVGFYLAPLLKTSARFIQIALLKFMAVKIGRGEGK
jgi:hypothetical protein